MKLAVAEALTNGLGTITEENLTNALNSYVGEGNYTLTGDATNGWDITIKSNGKVYHVDGKGTISNSGNSGNTGGSTGETKNPNYSVEVSDDDIAPAEVFLYEVIDENAKTARITEMNPEYCNSISRDISQTTDKKYAKLNTMMTDINIKKNSNIGKLALKSASTSEDASFSATYYDIVYNGKTLSDTLIVPDKKIINDVEYTITEVCLSVRGCLDYGSKRLTDIYFGWPNVKTIIFPNTVTKIYSMEDQSTYPDCNDTIEQIVLPKNLKIIGIQAFSRMVALKEIELPDSVEEIGKQAFEYSDKIPKITIGKNVSKVGSSIFWRWSKDQIINIYFKKSAIPEGWSSSWLDHTGDELNINYGNGEYSGSGSGSGSGY